MLNTESFYRVAMRHALREARQWIGSTSPNPPVGAAAIGKNGEILAVAAHRRAGEDHAEAALLKLCRERNVLSQVEAMAVTLEPCNHTGLTPPCAEAIIAAGIRTVAVGAKDPNPRVKGGGINRLRKAGIEVIEGIKSEACQNLIHAFAFFSKTGKPFVTVKRAFDASGGMIPPKGQKTFTSPESLALAHCLRKKADAILTGSGTILADNPDFTVRHVPDYKSKRRILAILDRRARVPKAYLEAATERGLVPVVYADLGQCIADLAQKNIQDVLVEAGPRLSDAILASPYWTLRVDIHKSDKDSITTAVNPRAPFPIPNKSFDLMAVLPGYP
ncbi:MAG: bifunctional diaminohydroxyphosphoribosylaminopyrimidine deaminase/5-amino-6-(5-phosphoribosylamino)uracil reductase RibD [Alphaproteobacteria bacterium]|nr:bifunctional diaminohydroxyphosphoribosylaminopyrimidine deaminase/5-amino-6-(5-phosphoribosylamino)uracil reductase RibD [Alphaproteobacteria bacterium]